MCYLAALYAPAGLKKNYFMNKNDSTSVMHEKKKTLKSTWWVPCLLFFGHPLE